MMRSQFGVDPILTRNVEPQNSSMETSELPESGAGTWRCGGLITCATDISIFAQGDRLGFGPHTRSEPSLAGPEWHSLSDKLSIIPTTGVQYAYNEYAGPLIEQGSQISMSFKANAYDKLGVALGLRG